MKRTSPPLARRQLLLMHVLSYINIIRERRSPPILCGPGTHTCTVRDSQSREPSKFTRKRESASCAGTDDQTRPGARRDPWPPGWVISSTWERSCRELFREVALSCSCRHLSEVILSVSRIFKENYRHPCYPAVIISEVLVIIGACILFYLSLSN
jgi:hypothetical protein